VKIPAGSQAVMLNITAKLKNSFLISQDAPNMLRSKSLNEKPLPEATTLTNPKFTKCRSLQS